MDEPSSSRRLFVAACANLASAGWLALNWGQIAAAADHTSHGAGAHGGGTAAVPGKITTLSPAEAADVDAIANQIVPGGAKPGARQAHAVVFIDKALGSFFAAQLPAFRQGLLEFQQAWATRQGAAAPFAAAPDAQQIAWLHEVDQTPFFTAVRRLTVLGMLALPKYGGNHDKLGWKLINVVDQHVWKPPFGDYEQDYAGFVPYPGTKPYTA